MAIFTYKQALQNNNVRPSDVKSVNPATGERKTSSFLSDAFDDVKQIGTDIATSFRERRAIVQEAQSAQARGDQGGGSTLFQTAGQGASLVSDVFGSIIKGGVKAILRQGAEDSIKQGIQSVAGPVVNSDMVESIITKYKSLDDETKRNLEGALGLGTLAVDVATLGVGKKGLEVGVKTAVNTGSKILDTTADTIKPLIKFAGEAGETFTKSADPVNIMQRVARIPKGAQAKFKQTAKESVGEFLNKRDIYGNTEQIATKLYKRFDKAKTLADTELAKLKGTFKDDSIKTAIDDLVAREARVSSPGAPSRDLSAINSLAKKYEAVGLDMTEINRVKGMYERNVKLDFLKKANVPEDVARANNVDDAIRSFQFKKADELGLKNLPAINRETRLSKQLLDAIEKETAGGAGNNAITLTDYILLAGADPTAISSFLGKKIFSSKGIQSAIAKRLYKGKKLGQVKAKTGPAKPGLLDFLKKKY